MHVIIGFSRECMFFKIDMPNVNEGKKRELGMPLQAQIYKLVLKIEVFISRTEGRQKET